MGLCLVDDMTERNRRRWLWGANAALVLAILGTGLAALAPLEAPAPSKAAPGPAAAQAAPEERVEPFEAYAAICQRNLLEPLFDAPPAPAAAAAMPGVRLMGTAIEPGFCYGLFRNALGEPKMVGVGESIEGAEVVAVAEQSVTLKFGGRTITLPVEKEPTPATTPAGAAGGRRNPFTPGRVVPPRSPAMPAAPVTPPVPGMPVAPGTPAGGTPASAPAPTGETPPAPPLVPPGTIPGNVLAPVPGVTPAAPQGTAE
jgi:hypothetical protein